MAQAMHTPGPWKVAGSETWGPSVRIASGRGAYDEKDRRKNKANAMLIAAAPDLLKLAEHVMAMVGDTYLEGHPEWWEIVEDARKALAKAEMLPENSPKATKKG